jgi:transcriptional regulator with XRE-family HTH domain
MSIGEALRLIRSINDLTQKELADELDLSSSYVSELERNNRDPSLSVLQKYAEFFEVPVSSLLMFAENIDDRKRGRSAKKVVSSGLLKLMELASRGRS